MSELLNGASDKCKLSGCQLAAKDAEIARLREALEYAKERADECEMNFLVYRIDIALGGPTVEMSEKSGHLSKRKVSSISCGDDLDTVDALNRPPAPDPARLHELLGEAAAAIALFSPNAAVLPRVDAALEMSGEGKAPFQHRVGDWMLACFGAEISADKTERNHRFLEEALELVQSLGCSQSEAHQLVDYVFGREQGNANQEVGGVIVTLAALCLANNLAMEECGETELARVWTKIEKIRAKQAAKPKHSPLPQAAPDPAEAMRAKEADALVTLAKFNIPVDIQELLVRGNPMRGIAPGALRAALKGNGEG